MGGYRKEYNKFGRNKKVEQFRNSREWKRLRADIVAADGGLDLWAYATRGEIVPGNSVHHIVPITEDWGRRLDPENLITLSKESHGYIESMYGTDKENEIKEQLVRIVRQYRRCV